MPSKYRDKRGQPEPEKSYYDLHGRKTTGHAVRLDDGTLIRGHAMAPRRGGVIGFGARLFGRRSHKTQSK